MDSTYNHKGMFLYQPSGLYIPDKFKDFLNNNIINDPYYYENLQNNFILALKNHKAWWLKLKPDYPMVSFLYKNNVGFLKELIGAAGANRYPNLGYCVNAGSRNTYGYFMVLESKL